MKTVIITDGKYRSAIAAARTFSRAGWQVVVTQTREDTKTDPPVFASRHVSERRWIDGAAADAAYPDRLLALTRAYARPVLFCVGAVTLAAVSRERERFAQSCDFLIAPPDVLDALNDKETVHRRALELGLPVPREYDGAPDRYPVVIKPRCGEKFGLKAADRYRIAANEAEYAAALEAMRRLCRSALRARAWACRWFWTARTARRRRSAIAAFGNIPLRAGRPPAVKAYTTRRRSSRRAGCCAPSTLSASRWSNSRATAFWR